MDVYEPLSGDGSLRGRGDAALTQQLRSDGEGESIGVGLSMWVRGGCAQQLPLLVRVVTAAAVLHYLFLCM